MFIVYDLINFIFTLFYLPVYLVKGKFHKDFIARFGVLPKDLHLDNPIWVHAVSVGEAKAVRGLIEGLRNTYPGKRFVISTVTPTGNKIAASIAKAGDLVTYLPLDFSFIVKRVIDKVNPCIFVIAETEIWPNLITRLYKKGIPVITVNGRISDGSFKGYSLIKFLISPLLNKVKLFCVQTDNDANRLKLLGALQSKIKVTGNMKFDTLFVKEAPKSIRLGLSADERLFIAGSTHKGEEEIILRVYRKLLNKFPKLRLLIAPRHPERAEDVLALAEGLGFCAVLASQFNSQNTYRDNPVFILDTVGELAALYLSADIVFIGRSLINKGGQNILEPAAAGKPVIFGPHMFNFRDIVQLFLKNNAAVMVGNEEELGLIVSDLLTNHGRVLELTNNAKRVILHNQGATSRNIEEISAILSSCVQ